MYRYSQEIPDSQYFFFGVAQEENGTPRVGCGTDDDPFVVCMTTRAHLMSLQEAAAKLGPDLLFHIDTTFKLNTLAYPAFVLAVSDVNRATFVVCYAVCSQRTRRECELVFRALADVYQRVLGVNFPGIHKLMSDADDAQYNALYSVYPNSSFIMCYFHVLFNVRKRLVGSAMTKATVIRDLHILHHADSQAVYNQLLLETLARWTGSSSVPNAFVVYFEKQWAYGRYSKWQVFHTAIGNVTLRAVNRVCI